jgi:hypothetical protein
VYQLGRDSTQCVRYDVSAVYLGTPGQDQQCPAHLVGQADTVSITGRTAGGSVVGAGGASAGAAGADAAGGGGGGQPVAVHQAAAASALSVSVTYGPDPGLVQQVVDSVQPAGPAGPSAVPQSANGGAGPSAVPQSAGAPSAKASAPAPAPVPSGAAAKPVTATSAAGAHPAGAASAFAAAPSATPVAPSAAPAAKPPAAKPPAAKPPATAAPGASKTPQPASTVQLVVRKVMPLPGFDTCTAPSLQAMKAWRKAYSTAAIYIGGTEMGCGYGNLSASWVHAVKAMGWSLIPIYVGVQAPCNSFSQEIVPSHASAEGTGAAAQAVLHAGWFGIGKRAPLYFDMEAYNNGNTACRNSVLSFLDAWTREIHALGYVSGVYSSAASGAEDLADATTVYGRPLAKPDSLWFALWDNRANLVGTPYVSGSEWSPGRRIKQYKGSHWQKVGGIKLDIDSDWVEGAVY